LVYIAAAHGDDPDLEDQTGEIIALSVVDGQKVWGKIIEDGPVFATPQWGMSLDTFQSIDHC
jgi:hypothetical protein